MANKCKQVLFNDGEGLDYTDLNDAQRFLDSKVMDLVVGPRTRTEDVPEQEAPFTPLSHLFCNGAGGYVAVSGTALRLAPTAGVFAQQITGYTGDDATLLLYYADAAELVCDFDAGHATNDRWDLVSVQLELEEAAPETRDFQDATTLVITSETLDKKYRVKMTVTVTKGIEDGSEAIPSVPAGDVRYFAVKIPATFNAVFPDLDDVIDYRVPMGYQSVTAFPKTFEGGIDWTYGEFNVLAGAGNDYIYAPILGGRSAAKLLRVHGVVTLDNSAVVNLVRLNVSSAGISYTILKDISDVFATTNDEYKIKDVSVGGYWLNGWTAGPGYGAEASGSTDDYPISYLAIQVQPGDASDSIGFFRFDIAAS